MIIIFINFLFKDIFWRKFFCEKSQSLFFSKRNMKYLCRSKADWKRDEWKMILYMSSITYIKIMKI